MAPEQEQRSAERTRRRVQEVIAMVPVRGKPEMGVNVEDAVDGGSTELAECVVDGGVATGSEEGPCCCPECGSLEEDLECCEVEGGQDGGSLDNVERAGLRTELRSKLEKESVKEPDTI